jgi:hypothetical protein
MSTRNKTTEVLFTTEDSGYALLLQFANPSFVETDMLILEHPCLGDGRCRVFVRKAMFCERLLYKFDHFVSGPDMALAINLIERHSVEIHKAIS